MICSYCYKTLKVKKVGNLEIPQKCNCIGQKEADMEEHKKLSGLDKANT